MTSKAHSSYFFVVQFCFGWCLFVSCLGFALLVGGWGILPGSLSYVLAGCFMCKGVVLRIFSCVLVHVVWVSFNLFASALCPWRYFPFPLTL